MDNLASVGVVNPHNGAVSSSVRRDETAIDGVGTDGACHVTAVARQINHAIFDANGNKGVVYISIISLAGTDDADLRET